MNEHRVIALRQKGEIDDPLTEILRAGARRLIAQAIEAEFETFLASNAELVLPDGCQQVVRHGHDPVRAIQTGIGPIDVQKPKARDRGAAAGARIRFTSNILPKWARRTRVGRSAAGSLFARDFGRGLPGGPRGLAGQGRSKPFASGDCAAERRVGRRIWAMAKTRSVGAPLCLRLGGWGLFAGAHRAASRMHAGADGGDAGGQEGTDRLSDGRAGKRSKLEGIACRSEGARLSIAPEVAVGDGALGFWRALDEAFPTTRHQRCWLHKTLKFSTVSKVHATQCAQGLAGDMAVAGSRCGGSGDDTFEEKYTPKYAKAVECLTRDRETMLTFFDFPPITGIICACRTRLKAFSRRSGIAPSA